MSNVISALYHHSNLMNSCQLVLQCETCQNRYLATDADAPVYFVPPQLQSVTE